MPYATVFQDKIRAMQRAKGGEGGSAFSSPNHTSLIQVNDLFLSKNYQWADFKGSP